MRLRARAGTFLVLVAAAAATPAACSPDSNAPPPNGGTGAGGSLFEGGLGCSDPTDTDGDFVADTMELAPDGDTDDDGLPDHREDDSDGDGAPDADEAVNALLDPVAPGQARDAPCDPLADTDGDGTPDLRDLDSDNDGLTDAQEALSGDGRCRVLTDCDGDGVLDVIEVAAGSDPADAASAPADPGLYFVLPYQGGEQTKDFTFSTSIDQADIYFLIDTTNTMVDAIDNLKTSLSTEILPAILNGDPNAVPPIPAIGDAWIGIGAFRDVPWSTYGQPGDYVYRHRFTINNQTFAGDVAPPVLNGGSYEAPANVTTILGSLTAAGGGDAPEATTQALWIAATNQPYNLTLGGLWPANTPYPCSTLEMRGTPCFRPGALPIFVVITDAPFHNGPFGNEYALDQVDGDRTYADAIAAIKAIDGKVVGVPVDNGGSSGIARLNLRDLAIQTESLYYALGTDSPLVASTDVSSGQVSTEVVRLLGQLAGAGLHDVTTSRRSYACAGGVDCTGDGAPDLAYQNPELEPGAGPFDAAQLISAVRPVEAPAPPIPYASLDDTTFFGVRGSAQVTFRVHAENTTLRPGALQVLRAVIRVVTPSGQLLGGAEGVKLVYLVIPEYVDVIE